MRKNINRKFNSPTRDKLILFYSLLFWKPTKLWDISYFYVYCMYRNAIELRELAIDILHIDHSFKWNTCCKLSSIYYCNVTSLRNCHILQMQKSEIYLQFLKLH